VIRVATRASTLARWQAERVGAQLGDDVEYVLVTTTGDRDQNTDLHQLAMRERSEHPGGVGGRGTGVFTKEVQLAVLDGAADVAVHSAKDLPSETPPGLQLVAIPERGDPRDALVGCSLEELPTAARIGTDSVRRRAQLANLRPDLTFGPLRGNIETRLRKRVDHGYDAVVIAYVALERLGLANEAAAVLDPSEMLPQVAQGALAVECRAGDQQTLARLQAIDDPVAHRTVAAERAFLAALGGGCSVPCGALATAGAGGVLRIDALLASLDGHVVVRTTVDGEDAAAVGAAAAAELLRSFPEDLAS
jgi:hydroxymethylbilane synthase